MVRRHNRLLIAFHVISDASLGLIAFLLAYFLRFQTGLLPYPKGVPPLRQYVNVLPFILILVPLAFQLQGLYRLRRGRSHRATSGWPRYLPHARKLRAKASWAGAGGASIATAFSSKMCAASRSADDSSAAPRSIAFNAFRKSAISVTRRT